MTSRAKSQIHRDWLSEQIDAIGDTTRENVVDLIIHVGGKDATDDETMRAGLRAIRNRAMAVTGTELLPPAREDMEKAFGKTSGGKRFRGAAAMSSQMAIAANRVGRSMQDFRETRKSDLESFLRHGKLADSIGRVLERAKDSEDNKYLPKRFWASDSVRVAIPRSDLRGLLDSRDSILGVFANRRIEPPRYSVAKAATKDRVGSSVATWGLERIGAMAAWGGFGARGGGVRVAVLDTGIDATHPDIFGRLEKFAEFNWGGHEMPGAIVRDTDIHGTHVAGTILGGRFSGRHIGVAPDARLLAGLVLDGKKGGSDAQVLSGLNWAINEGVDVINLSLGGLTLNPVVDAVYQKTLLRAFQAGIVVVAAIGNDGSQTTGSPGNDFFSFAVGAVDSEDRVAGFSGGRTHVIRNSPVIPQEDLPIVYSKPEISAPGVAVHSAVPGAKWEALNGTSMATPHVSGAIAALLSVTNLRGLAPAQRASIVADLLIGSCVDLGESGQDHRYGFGRLDLYSAINHAFSLGYGS
jgi:subtilisin family serine protease